MSISTRIKELNKRLAQKLTAKGVEASETETMTSLINKIDNLPTGQSDIDFSIFTDWRYFSYYNNRNTLVEKLKYSDTSKGTNLSYMFSGCSRLTTVPQFDTSNGILFSNMFYGCSSLTTVPQLDTSKGTSFGNMFYGCSSLTTVPQLDTSKGTNFINMFSSCSSLTNLTITGSINASEMDLKAATKLSKASITSVVNALSASASGKSITFSKTAIGSAFETSSGAADGSASDEWLNLIATKSNWTISLS